MIRQNPTFPTNPIEMAREMGVLWRELATELKSMTKIKSIQTDVFYATTGTEAGTDEDDRYKDITITSVNTAKSVVMIQPIIDPTYGQLATTARLTSATNLRISNSDSGSNFIGARWTVIEYDF
jgi:hypothetical protein